MQEGRFRRVVRNAPGFLFQQALHRGVEVDIPHDPAVAPFQTFLGLGKYVLGEVAVHPLLKQEGIAVIVDLVELSQCRGEISLRQAVRCKDYGLTFL